MSKYDGPSFYKKNHSKIEDLNKKQDESQSDHKFKDNYRQSLPSNVRTRDEIKENALDYMETPSRTNEATNKTNSDNRFQSKKIPASLQKLDGWRQTSKDQEVVSEIEERLQKEADSYLLFADETEAVEKTEKTQKKRKRQKEKRSVFKNERIQADIDPETKKKVKRVHEKTSSDLSKPTAGLHRSLSNIMDDDQKALKNGKDNLNSLFNDD